MMAPGWMRAPVPISTGSDTMAPARTTTPASRTRRLPLPLSVPISTHPGAMSQPSPTVHPRSRAPSPMVTWLRSSTPGPITAPAAMLHPGPMVALGSMFACELIISRSMNCMRVESSDTRRSTDGPWSGLLARKVHPQRYDAEWPLLGVLVSAPRVVADNADAKCIESTKEEDGEHGSGESGYLVRAEDSSDEHQQPQQ